MNHPLLAFDHVSKIYGEGESQVRALDDANFTIDKGSFTAIFGPSGSGKSTLLHIMGLLDRPSHGTYRINGEPASSIHSDNERARLRRETFGFVFQQFNLLPRLTALENVMLPAVYAGRRDRKERALTLLDRVGLADRAQHRPNQLSGGQQQRVAIARALMNDPRILLADEPTGNLDRITGAAILELLNELHRQGETVVIVTHDLDVAALAEHQLTVVDGKVSLAEPSAASSSRAKRSNPSRTSSIRTRSPRRPAQGGSSRDDKHGKQGAK